MHVFIHTDRFGLDFGYSLKAAEVNLNCVALKHSKQNVNVYLGIIGVIQVTVFSTFYLHREVM